MTAPDAARLRSFRAQLYGSFTAWGDALFELCDASMCSSAPVGSVPSLSLEPVFRRSHGSLYKALALGRVDEKALRLLLVSARPAGWPMVFAVDASTWDRCDAECSPERGFYYSASKHSAGQPVVAGWSYQWISQLNWARDSWTAPLDVMRIPPCADATNSTVERVRRLVGLPPVREKFRSSSSTPAMTPLRSATSSPTCAARCSLASETTGSSTPILLLVPTDRHKPEGDRHAMGGVSSAPIRPPGVTPTTAWSRPTPAMAPSRCRLGTTCTRG